jgi:hypothetical protein
MSTTASAVTTVESAATPATTEFNGWDDSGTPIRVETEKTSPTKQDSAPAEKKDTAASSDSATENKDQKKAADSASDSATDKDTQKPHQKTKEDSERRFKELLDERNEFKRRLEALERKPSDEKRDDKQVSQPVKEEYKPLDEKEFFAKNQKATYEDFVRAAAKHEAKWEARQEVAQAIHQERQRIQQEAATKELQGKFNDAVARYGQEEADKIIPAVAVIVDNPKIPLAVKDMLGGSDVLVDLVYVLQSDAAEFKKFTDLCQSNPAAAIRKLVTTEALVQEQLKGKSAAKNDKDGADDSGKGTPARGEDGKFQSSEKKGAASEETKPRAPKPPSEVGGRGTTSVSDEVAAVQANDFRALDSAMTRRFAAQLKR